LLQFLENLLQSIHRDTLTGALVYACILVMLGLLGTLVIRKVAKEALKRDTVDITAVHFLRPLSQIFLWVVVFVGYAHLIPSLRSLGTAALAGVSVVSIVIGLAAQNTLSSLIAGIAILIYCPFRIGDRIQVMTPTGVETGIVETVSLGYTVSQTFDNRRVVLPNSLASSQTTVNLTSVDARILAAVPIGIAYTADIERARDILLNIAGTYFGKVETLGCPVIQLGASSVTLSVRAWCTDVVAARDFEWKVYEQAKVQCEQAGIEIPYSYQNVILKKNV
jgi:small-conductance mechanosensitive channel